MFNSIFIGVAIVIIAGIIAFVAHHIINSDTHPKKKDIVFRDVCEQKHKGLEDCVEARIDGLHSCITAKTAGLQEQIKAVATTLSEVQKDIRAINEKI